MKLGFLDSIFNYADVYETAVTVLDQRIPSVNLERLTAPHLLKIPLYSKMLFQKGCDCVIVFLTMLPEDAQELDLVHEKIIDLEIAEGKPVFFCIISSEEFKEQKDLEAAMEAKLGMIAEAASKIVSAPASLSSDIANSELTNAMTMFSTMSESAGSESEPEITDDLGIDGDSGGRSLF